MNAPVILERPALRSILVIDDAPEVLAVIGVMLRDSGYLVHCAASVREAMDMLRSAAVQVVVTDITMPDSDGFELIQTLRKAETPPRIVAMTGGNAALWAEDCAKIARLLGADAAIVKPFELPELIRAIAGEDSR